MCDYPGSVVVGQTPVKIIDQSNWRTGLFIRNLSDNTVSIGFDHAAELNKGITLFAKECYSMSKWDYSTADVYAVADAEGSLVSFQVFSYGKS